MIPRHHSILFVLLLLASIAMGGLLWQMRQRAHQRLLEGEDSAPTQAPAITPAREATLIVASDADGSMQSQVFTLPLPQDPGARGRAILGKLLDVYASNGASHPVSGGSGAVVQVFLLPAQELYPSAGKNPPFVDKPALTLAKASTPASPLAGSSQEAASAKAADASEPSSPQMAVVNLTGAFANGHPSGLQAETLTILSLCATLHANLPRVTQVRFLVDGETRPTLAGHADLTRTYLTGGMGASETVQP
jgi:hypothetical protein